jgi:hypothetical protein
MIGIVSLVYGENCTKNAIFPRYCSSQENWLAFAARLQVELEQDVPCLAEFHWFVSINFLIRGSFYEP